MQLWHEIHYHRIMEKHHRDFLTPLQKFRCRKRYHGIGESKVFLLCCNIYVQIVEIQRLHISK